jgi:hypothetical protein
MTRIVLMALVALSLSSTLMGPARAHSCHWACRDGAWGTGSCDWVCN